MVQVLMRGQDHIVSKRDWIGQQEIETDVSLKIGAVSSIQDSQVNGKNPTT